jgi:hypothetical protein
MQTGPKNMNAGFESCHLEFREAVSHPNLERLTAELKDMGQRLVPGKLSREAYIEKNATLSILFLIDVQKWKSTYFGKRGDFLQLDAPECIAEVFYDFFHDGTDYEKIQTLRRITRLGRMANAQMERSEVKKASIIAQFLDPMDWGLLDWSSTVPTRLFFEPVSERVIESSLAYLRSKRSCDFPLTMDVGLAIHAGVME